MAGQQGWMITKYDMFSRPIYTGWEAATTITTAVRQAKQTNQNNATTLVETKTTGVTVIDGVAVNYTNNVAPTSFKLLTVNYYDDYTFANMPPLATTVLGDAVYYNNTKRPKGMPTGSWVRVLENSTATRGETSYTLYDYKARPIRTHTQNHLGGYTQVESKLDFMGKALFTETRHKRLATSIEVLVREDFTYSPQDRLMMHTHKIDNNPTQYLARNEYAELGQLKTKYVGNYNGNFDPLQKVDYAYNIRGWLTNINDINNLQQGSDVKDLFSFKINYNTVQGNAAGVVPLFNGNIAETYWRTAEDDKVRNYGYKYDDLNRLREAIYQKPNISIPNSYREYLEYDLNGNITHLERNGGLDGNTGYLAALPIDNLTYRYKPSSNQLLEVYDNTYSDDGFTDGASQQGIDDYKFDQNGNLTADENKSIVSIAYNHLNLPTQIIFQRGSDFPTINYLYNALGVKVQKIVNPASRRTQPVTTNYLSGFQYQNGVLQFFPHTEGYVNVTGGTNYNYVYNYTDHLGNIRLSYGLDQNNVLKIIEENNYYPFGLKHENYNTEQYNYDQKLDGSVKLVRRAEPNPELISLRALPFDPNQPIAVAPVGNALYQKKFLGQERQEELGLNWDTFRHRNYDYAIDRFFGVDPVSEEYMSISTYQFAHNNPVWKIEIEGLEGTPSNGKPDISNHEPVKVVNKPLVGYIGGGLVETKIIQKTTTEVVKEVAKETVKTGGKVFGTVFALLTDYMSPNFGGRTIELQPQRKFDLKIDEKYSLKDHKVAEKTIEETGIKIYEANPKHGKDKKGNASAAPQNPQEVLENSLELPGNTTRRVGVDTENKEFNVFDEHSEGKFHGHVRKWGELTQQMKNVLIDAGLVNKKGKILNN